MQSDITLDPKKQPIYDYLNSRARIVYEFYFDMEDWYGWSVRLEYRVTRRSRILRRLKSEWVTAATILGIDDCEITASDLKTRILAERKRRRRFERKLREFEKDLFRF